MVTMDRTRMLADLRELVKALDRRVPRLERAGESKIAREAEALRMKAMDRIERLQSCDALPAVSDLRSAGLLAPPPTPSPYRRQ